MLVRLEGTVRQFEGKLAVLVLKDGQELRIQKDMFKEISIGDVFSIQIMPEAEASMEREELSRTILNQLLNDK